MPWCFHYLVCLELVSVGCWVFEQPLSCTTLVTIHVDINLVISWIWVHLTYMYCHTVHNNCKSTTLWFHHRKKKHVTYNTCYLQLQILEETIATTVKSFTHLVQYALLAMGLELPSNHPVSGQWPPSHSTQTRTYHGNPCPQKTSIRSQAKHFYQNVNRNKTSCLLFPTLWLHCV